MHNQSAAIDATTQPTARMAGRLLRFGVIAEGFTAVVGTSAAIYLHLANATWAGALWRDEANTAAAAARPTRSGVWDALGTDNFPLLSTLLVRI